MVLRDAGGRVLLQRRADFNVWGLPGGTLELGESLADCARRELKEETGLEAGGLRLVGLYTDPQWDTTYPNGDQVQQFTVCFEGAVAGGRMQVDGTENYAQRFFSPDEIPFGELPAYYAAMLRDALQGGEPAFSPPFSRPERISQVARMRAWLGPDCFIGVGAAVVVQREDGRVLVGRRIDDESWDFPGGYMDLGENAAAAVVRETREECGLEIVPQRLLGIFSPREAWTYPNGDQVQPVTAVFYTRAPQVEPYPDGEEFSHLDWLLPEEILRLETAEMFRSYYRSVVEALRSGGTF